ncbi:MAG: ferritin [Candidatus Thermoplasmatota archaeon]|nr:ferritin [Candidatus Thermoplasmatota archaeon]
MPELNDELIKLCNDQIDHELEASQLYLSMAAWMRAQSDEEREHALKFYEHMAERGNRIHIGGVPEPKQAWEGPLDAFQEAFAHEQKVTQQIYEIYKAAETHHDYALQGFLDWFVEEQIEEENSTRDVVELLERVGGDPYRLYKVDRELAARDA